MEKKILPETSDSIHFVLFRWRETNISRSYVASVTQPYHESATGLADRLHTFPGIGWPNAEHQPGSPASLFIRGMESALSNDPLYVVDGILLNAGIQLPKAFSFMNPLTGLNVKDIENITILKDHAGTALYGTAGANGVILIATKSGGADSLHFSYHMQAGMRRPPAKRTEMMATERYLSLISESLFAAGNEPLGENPVSKANLASWPLLANHFGGIDPVNFLNRQPAKNSTSQFDGNFSVQFKIRKYVTLNSSLGGSYNDYGQSYTKPLLADDFAFTGNNSRRISALFAQTNYAYHELLDIELVFRREALQRQNGESLFGIFPAASMAVGLQLGL